MKKYEKPQMNIFNLQNVDLLVEASSGDGYVDDPFARIIESGGNKQR